MFVREVFFAQKGQSMFVAACHQYVRVCKQNGQRICFFFFFFSFFPSQYRGKERLLCCSPLNSKCEKENCFLRSKGSVSFSLRVPTKIYSCEMYSSPRSERQTRNSTLKSAQVFEAHEGNFWKDQKAFRWRVPFVSAACYEQIGEVWFISSNPCRFFGQLDLERKPMKLTMMFRHCSKERRNRNAQ